MNHLKILRESSIASVLQQEIEELIMSGELQGGSRLNESALASRFNVSRGPIREACRALAETGLLDLVPNRGHFVRSVSPQEADELYQVRGALFGLALELLAKRITAEELAQLDDMLDEMDGAAARGSVEEYYPLNLRFHGTLVRLSGNRRLVADYEALIKELHLFRARGLVHGGGLVVSNREHRAIVDALRAGDGAAAAGAATRHVENGRQRMHKVPRD